MRRRGQLNRAAPPDAGGSRGAREEEDLAEFEMLERSLDGVAEAGQLRQQQQEEEEEVDMEWGQGAVEDADDADGSGYLHDLSADADTLRGDGAVEDQSLRPPRQEKEQEEEQDDAGALADASFAFNDDSGFLALVQGNDPKPATDTPRRTPPVVVAAAEPAPAPALPLRRRAAANTAPAVVTSTAPLVRKRFNTAASTQRPTTTSAVSEDDIEARVAARVAEIVASRLAALDEEVARNKRCAAQARRSKAMHEAEATKLRERRAQFDLWCRQACDDETRRRSERMQRRKEERRVMQRQVRASSLPDRKGRAEIEALQATITRMTLEAKKDKAKRRATEQRLAGRIKELQARVVELEGNLRYAGQQSFMQSRGAARRGAADAAGAGADQRIVYTVTGPGGRRSNVYTP